MRISVISGWEESATAEKMKDQPTSKKLLCIHAFFSVFMQGRSSLCFFTLSLVYSSFFFVSSSVSSKLVGSDWNILNKCNHTFVSPPYREGVTDMDILWRCLTASRQVPPGQLPPGGNLSEVELVRGELVLFRCLPSRGTCPKWNLSGGKLSKLELVKTTLWMCTKSQKGDHHKNLDFRPDFCPDFC